LRLYSRALSLGPYGDPRGEGALSYKRGTPVLACESHSGMGARLYPSVALLLTHTPSIRRGWNLKPPDGCKQDDAKLRPQFLSMARKPLAHECGECVW